VGAAVSLVEGTAGIVEGTGVISGSVTLTWPAVTDGIVGAGVGAFVGAGVGAFVGAGVGAFVGAGVGAFVGANVGRKLGELVG